MSYKHLTGRLIETQRSMIGEPAIRIARSLEGVSVTDDGAVTAVEGDGYAVVAELADRYTEILGNAAESRLVAAADEFRDDVVLPPALGGPADPAEAHEGAGDRPAPAETTAADPQTGVASDGGTVAVPAETNAETDAAPGPFDHVVDDSGATDAPDDDPGAVSVPEPLTVDYSLASDLSSGDYAGTDLASVYLLPGGEDDWQAPVSVEEAVVDALVAATGLSESDVATPVESIDPARLLATLHGEDGETVSFGVEGVTVTFHRSGSVAVHE